jgi:hypothetical protein
MECWSTGVMNNTLVTHYSNIPLRYRTSYGLSNF